MQLFEPIPEQQIAHPNPVHNYNQTRSMAITEWVLDQFGLKVEICVQIPNFLCSLIGIVSILVVRYSNVHCSILKMTLLSRVQILDNCAKTASRNRTLLTCLKFGLVRISVTLVGCFYKKF